MTKTIFAFVFAISFNTLCIAQNAPKISATRMADSIKQVYLEQAAIRNPVLRQINISTDIILPGDLESQLNHQPLFKGKGSTIRTTINFNIPLMSLGKTSFSISANYAQARLAVNDIQSFQPDFGNASLVFNKSVFSITPTFQRIDSLFGKQFFFMASATGMSNDFTSLKRVSYLLTALFLLKQTNNTRFGLGLVINIDPSLKIPAFLLITYWHKFDNNIEFNFTVPSGVGFRKPLSDKLWLGLGSSLGGSVAFFNLNYPSLPRDVNYTTIDLKSGAGLEYRVGKKLIFSLNSGILTPISQRAFDRTKSTSDYFVKNHSSNVPYINFGFSVLPFLR